MKKYPVCNKKNGIVFFSNFILKRGRKEWGEEGRDGGNKKEGGIEGRENRGMN